MDIEKRNTIIQDIADQIQDMFKDVYEVGGQVVQRKYCEEAAHDCVCNKADLIEMLSKHPNWDEDNLRVHFRSDFKRPKDKMQARIMINYIAGQLTRLSVDQRFEITDTKSIGGYLYSIYDEPILTLGEALTTSPFRAVFYEQPTITTEGAELVKAILPDAHIHAGAKTTRALYKLLTQYGFEEKLKDKEIVDELNAFTGEVTQSDARRRVFGYYTKYADYMNELTVTRHTCLSVNPMDFLHMSHGNSWTSCHDIRTDDESGCYSAGCWSYAYDAQTLIFFTVDADVDDDRITYAPKYTRQLYFWNKMALMPSRIYPATDNLSDPLYTENRAIVEQIIADCCGFGNLWKKLPFSSTDDGRHRIHTEGLHYPDYRFHDYPIYAPSSLLPETADEMRDLTTFYIGSDSPICVICGDTLDEGDYPVCSDCASGGGYECCCCGERMRSEDDGEWIDGDWYCRYCVDNHFTWDDLDGRYIRNEYAVRVEGLGYTHEDNCYPGNDIFICAECGEAFYQEEYIDVDGDYYCLACAEDRLEVCDRCGEYHRTEDMHNTDNGERICENCVESDEFICDCCGTVHPLEDLAEKEDLGRGVYCNYCRDCYETRRHVCEDCGKVFYLSTDGRYITFRDDSHIEERVCQNCLMRKYRKNNAGLFERMKNSTADSFPGRLLLIERGLGSSVTEATATDVERLLEREQLGMRCIYKVLVPLDEEDSAKLLLRHVYNGYIFAEAHYFEDFYNPSDRAIAAKYMERFIEKNKVSDDVLLDEAV